jgi:hypothetical protein
LITWKSKKQSVVSCSSVETEYQAMAQILCKLMYLLEELRFDVQLPMTMYCDNQATIHITFNPMFHERTCWRYYVWPMRPKVSVGPCTCM